MRYCNLFGAVLIAAILGMTGCQEKKQAAPPPPGVVVVPAVAGYVTSSHTLIGQVKANDSVDLVARVKGFLRKRNFTEGQMVKKGRLLFLIEQDQYKAEVTAAKAALLKSYADQKNANIDYNRQKTLYEQKAVSQRVFDNAAAKKMAADAAVLSAKADLANAQLRLSYTEVKAPFDGLVGIAKYSVGNVVGPDSGMLDSIVSMDPIRVQFNLSELYLLEVAKRHSKNERNVPGVNVCLEFQDGSRYGKTGKITYWNNKINPTTGTLLMQATFRNQEMVLIPGMYVKVVLEFGKQHKALLIPRCGILLDQQGDYVLVVGKDNKVERRNVKTGPKQGANISVEKGLKEGEMVIVEGVQKVRIGSPVKPIVNKSYSVEAAAADMPVISNTALKIKTEEEIDKAIKKAKKSAPKPAPAGKAKTGGSGK